MRDREKQKQKQHESYLRNKERVYAKVVDRRRRNREWFAGYKKSKRCNRCGQSHPATLDFHHKYGKDNGIADLVSSPISLERIKAEITKCEVLCANCHRILHWEEKNNLGVG